MEIHLAKKYLPEYNMVFLAARGSKPRDFDYTHSFVWNGKTLTKGPGYSYDTMITEGVNPYERRVDVPKGTRMWVVTYDGQWGGYWSRVLVFVHPDELPAPFKELPAPEAAKPEVIPEITPAKDVFPEDRMERLPGETQEDFLGRRIFAQYEVGGRFGPKPITPEVTYDASLEAFRKAAREFTVARNAYRAKEIGDEAFLKAKAEFDKASQIADAAETAYIKAKAIPKPPAVEAEDLPMSVVEYDLRYTLDELREKARQAGLSASGSKKEIAAKLKERGIK